MADYPALTLSDLATFSGRPNSWYSGYADQAISQAVLLFKMATCLASLPDDPDKYQLAVLGILSMADSFTLEQPYQEVKANPIQSETIGSYSYSKVNRALNQVKVTSATGVAWFDMAVERLGVCTDTSGISHGGVEVFEHDALFTQGVDSNNTRVITETEKHWWSDPDTIISRN